MESTEWSTELRLRNKGYLECRMRHHGMQCVVTIFGRINFLPGEEKGLYT